MRLLLALLVLVALAVPATAAATPAIHAHRGGSVLDGVPTFGENTLPAFRNAARVEGAVLEFDVKLTRDRVPVVFHDATLDRTTPCGGRIADRAFAELAACPVDVLGAPGSTLPSAPAPEPVPIPRLVQVLALARATGASVNLEIKNQPTDPDFDATHLFATRVMNAVVASGLPRDRIIVQSFWPANLEVAKLRAPGVALSLLTLAAMNDGGPAFAAGLGYAWVSPGGVPTPLYMTQARLLGRRVVPYTLNTPADVRAAAAAGVDAVITDDPRMARAALGAP